MLSPESVKRGSGICQNGRKNSLQGRLNQNPGLAFSNMPQGNPAYYMN